jgi:hypothetical protein
VKRLEPAHRQLGPVQRPGRSRGQLRTALSHHGLADAHAALVRWLLGFNGFPIVTARSPTGPRARAHWRRMRRGVRPLLCELHAHTTWSDGELSLGGLVDLCLPRGDRARARPRTLGLRAPARARLRAHQQRRRQLFSWVAEAGLPGVACGDLHRAEQLPGWTTLVPCARDEEALVDYLRSSRPVVPDAPRAARRRARRIAGPAVAGAALLPKPSAHDPRTSRCGVAFKGAERGRRVRPAVRRRRKDGLAHSTRRRGRARRLAPRGR